MSDERRRSARKAFGQGVGTRAGSSQALGVGVDLSEEGVAILGATGPSDATKQGDRVLVTFRIDGVPIVVHGETVNLNRQGKLLRSGIRFVQLTRTQRLLIARHVQSTPT